MSDEADFETPQPRKPTRKRRRYKSKADMAAEIKQLKAALKEPVRGDLPFTEVTKTAPKVESSKPAAPRDTGSDAIFDGLGAGTCASGCGNGFCVITHDGNCAHPMTSPLQPAYFNKPDVMERYMRAKKYCARMRLDKLLEAGLGM